jgi:hypothetical protein
LYGSNLEQDEIETKLSRLSAYVFALEELIVAAVNSMPNRDEIVRTVKSEGQELDDLALNEPFADEQLLELQEARLRVLALISKA